MTAIDYRSRLEKLMHETIRDEALRRDWRYLALRPRPMPHRPWHSGENVTGDCSKGVQFLCWWADLPRDPMGMHWGPYGNSSTLAAHLQHLARASELLIGDIVTFGLWGNSHAAMVMARGSDPLLWSFGHQGAPNTYRLSQDPRVHQFLRNPIPEYVPTRAERLRAKTGYWAWVHWRLGSGNWAHYPPMTRKVRPHVPRVIPPLWWRHYRLFLASRHLGNEIDPLTPKEESPA
jgi:hypothetical protein